MKPAHQEAKARAELNERPETPETPETPRGISEAYDRVLERLEAMRRAGYERQSIGEFRTIEALIRRVERAPTAAQITLLRRAEARLEAFEASAEAERSALATRFQGESGAHYREAIAEGDLESARRALRRVRRGGTRLLGKPRKLARIDELPSVEGEAREPERDATPRRSATQAKEGRYREAALDAAAELTLLRAKRQLPEPELRGRYHAPTIAASSLGIMERVGRPYLLEQIARLEAYEAVAALISEYKPKKAKPRAKKGRTTKR